MRNFEKILERCKCGVYLSVNEHRDLYLLIEEYIEDNLNEVDPEVKSVIIETDTVVVLQFYPDTPVGFYEVVHYDVNAAIEIALSVLEIKCE